jgi:DNA-binding FadR family transcriptional regulator
MRDRIYERIAAGVKRQIADGTLKPGARLPAEREMARRHGISRVTVREAYRSLEQSGIVSIRRGAAGGAVVAQPPPVADQALLLPLVALMKALTKLTLKTLASSEAHGSRTRRAPNRMRASSKPANGTTRSRHLN